MERNANHSQIVGALINVTVVRFYQKSVGGSQQLGISFYPLIRIPVNEIILIRTSDKLKILVPPKSLFFPDW